MRPGKRLRAGTRRALVPSGPPTDEIPVWTSPDGVDVDTARAAIDLAMRAGIAMLATGAASADVVGAVLLITRAYGLQSVHIDITYTSINLSYHRGPHADPITVLRVVRSRSQDFTRLERLRVLVLDLSRDPIPLDDARVRFDAVISASHPYRRWLVTGASAVLAAAVALLIGGGWLVTVISFVCAIIIDRTQYWLGRFGVAPFFAQCLAAAIPTLGATLVVLAALHGSDLAGRASPSLVVASGIVLLLSGLSVVGAAEDALAGYYVTAGARAFEVVVLTIGIVIGISFVLAIGNRSNLYVAVTTATQLDRNVWLQLSCAAVIAGAFAISSYAMGRAVVMSAILGAFGWWVSTTLINADIGTASSGAMAAALIGVIARAWSRQLKMSALAVTTAGIVPLLPGRAVYQGISEIISEPGAGMSTGMATLAGAAGVGLGLAAGVSIGNYAAGILGAWRLGWRMPRIAGVDVPHREPAREAGDPGDDAVTHHTAGPHDRT